MPLASIPYVERLYTSIGSRLKGTPMTGHHDRVQRLQPSQALYALIADPVRPAFASRFLMCKYAGILLATIAIAGCSVPVVILAVQTAQYVFGR